MVKTRLSQLKPQVICKSSELIQVPSLRWETTDRVKFWWIRNKVRNKLPSIPMTVNHRAPFRPIQRPAKPATIEFIKGIKTMAANIFLLLLREYSSVGEHVLCTHETSVRFRLFPFKSIFIRTILPLLYKKDFHHINDFYFY